MKNIRIERDLCIGSGNCVSLAPGAFELGDDEIAAVADTPTADDAELMHAADCCPAGAIFLEES